MCVFTSLFSDQDMNSLRAGLLLALLAWTSPSTLQMCQALRSDGRTCPDTWNTQPPSHGSRGNWAVTAIWSPV